MRKSARTLILVGFLTAVSACGQDTGTGGDHELVGDPIRIGFVNLEGGTISLPEMRIGAEQGAAYVNEQLDGINGRPIEYVRCDTDGSPETSIDCANKFIESDVVAVQQGADLGSDAMLPILETRGIPFVGHAPYGPQQQSDTSANVFLFGVAREAQSVATISYFVDRDMPTLRLFQGDSPAARAVYEDVILPAAESVGADVKILFYDVTKPDFNVLAASAMADDPDVIGAIASTEADCTAFINALRTAAYSGEILGAGCSDFVETLGAPASDVITFTDLWRPSDLDTPPAQQSEEISTFLTYMEDAGHADLIDGFARLYFSDTVNLARILATIDGDITPASATAALESATDFDAFMGGTISCDGSAWPGENACGNGVLVYRVSDEGVMEATVDEFVTAEG